jgi:hypothetical protein
MGRKGRKSAKIIKEERVVGEKKEDFFFARYNCNAIRREASGRRIGKNRRCGHSAREYGEGKGTDVHKIGIQIDGTKLLGRPEGTRVGS